MSRGPWSAPARLWGRLWRRAWWRRVVRHYFAPKKDVPGGASSATQARFWRDLREGQRIAEKRASSNKGPVTGTPTA